MNATELPGTPDLVDLVEAARDAGHEVFLFERPMPDAVSVAGLGRAYEIVAGSEAAQLEDSTGTVIDAQKGPPIAAATQLWRRLAARLEGSQGDGITATGPVALGGFAFRLDRDPGGAWSGFPTLLLRVPELAVSRVRGRTFATSIGEMGEALLELPRTFAARTARQLQLEAARPAEAWEAAVGEASERMRGGAAAKVVLARELIVHGDGPLSAGSVVRSLRSAYPACFTYLVSGADGTAFVGASPELLIRRRGNTATSQPMAGSAARGADEAEDELLAADLLASAKDRAEHEVVVEAVASALRRVSQSVVSPAAPVVVRFTNIQHLATTLTAVLAGAAPNALELAGTLHPTPAVGGSPREAALRLIDRLEEMERGWYAGAVGWMDGRGDGEFCVAVRCGLLWEDGARLYAGNGIMPDSVPARELQETELKFRALVGALAS